MRSLTFISLGREAETSREINEALAGSARTRLLANCEDPDQLLADALRLRPSAAIIALGAGNQDKEFALIRQLVTACSDTAIIVASYDASPSLILGSIRAGAREFLQLPINAAEFKTVLDRIEELTAAGETKRGGRTVAVFSGKGGAGVSFFATNLAPAMNVPTALTDLNLQAGDAASLLGGEPKNSIADFVRNP